MKDVVEKSDKSVKQFEKEIIEEGKEPWFVLAGHVIPVYIREKTLMDGSVLVMHFQKEFLKKYFLKWTRGT